jgi:hypothetical protein
MISFVFFIAITFCEEIDFLSGFEKREEEEEGGRGRGKEEWL